MIELKPFVWQFRSGLLVVLVETLHATSLRYLIIEFSSDFVGTFFEFRILLFEFIQLFIENC